MLFTHLSNPLGRGICLARGSHTVRSASEGESREARLAG